MSKFSLSDYISQNLEELDVDAVGLWEVISIQDNYNFTDEEFRIVIMEMIKAFISNGAKPVYGPSFSSFFVIHEYGYSAPDVALNIYNDWFSNGGAIEGNKVSDRTFGVWFSLVENDLLHCQSLHCYCNFYSQLWESEGKIYFWQLFNSDKIFGVEKFINKEIIKVTLRMCLEHEHVIKFEAVSTLNLGYKETIFSKLYSTAEDGVDFFLKLWEAPEYKNYFGLWGWIVCKKDHMSLLYCS